MKIPTLFFTILLCVLTACNSADDNSQDNIPPESNCTLNNRYTEQDIFSASDIVSNIDITYGNAIDWLGNSQDLLLDAYYPSATVDSLAQRPAMLLIHGGGFQGGNKAGWANICRSFAKKGYVVFCLGYRLGWDTSNAQNQILAMYRAHQDAKAAMRYIVDNAAVYGVDTNWLFIGGSSAGAVTALNDIYLTQNDWNSLIPGIQAQLGALESSGNSLTNTYNLKGVFNNWGATYLDYIDENELTPMISFHGDADTTVPIDTGELGFSGSRVISNLLENNAVCYDLTVKPGGGHGIYNSDSGREFMIGRASCFFKSIMCNTCTDFNATTRVDAMCSFN